MVSHDVYFLLSVCVREYNLLDIYLCLESLVCFVYIVRYDDCYFNYTAKMHRTFPSVSFTSYLNAQQYYVKYSKRRQEYKYVIEQSTEYTSLMIRQHVAGGKRFYDPKMDTADVWETYTKNNNVHEMEELIVEILNPKNPSPVIVSMEQDLTNTDDPNTYHLLLGFPPTSERDGGGENRNSINTPQFPKMYRRVRVPLVVFCEKLASAFEKQMTSTTLCFVADASSGMGSELLTSVVDQCNHGVVSLPFSWGCFQYMLPR